MLRILPFDEAQIRDYLTANLPSIDVGRAMEVIGAVHNLRDLAARPYLLSLMRLSLPDFEKSLASGKAVRSIDLYRKVVAAWLLRDQGKHRIDREDKARIMQALAHHMWSESAKEPAHRAHRVVAAQPDFIGPCAERYLPRAPCR